MKYEITGTFSMAINVLDGSDPPESVLGTIAVTLNSVVVDMDGVVLPPVVDPPSSVDGVLDRELSSIVSLMDGNVTSPPVSGTTHLVPGGTSMVAVRALNVSFGDEVLFEKGNSFVVNGSADRLLCQSGVRYGNYGTGANPEITSNGSSLSPGQANNFIGVIEVNSKNNVTIDGFRITAGNDINSNYFLLWSFESDNITIRNIECYDSEGGGIVSTRSTNLLIEDCEVHDVVGRPHESFTMAGGSNIVLNRIHSHDNGHAAVALKENVTDVEIKNSLFEATGNDPMAYMERSDRVRVHHCLMRNSSQLRPEAKPLNTIGIEGFADVSIRYARNIEIDHCTIYNADKILQKINVKGNTYAGVVAGTPHPIFENIHWHHNTLHTGNVLGNSGFHGFHTKDNRPAAEQNPTLDWVNLVFENNIIYNVGNAKSIKLSNNISVTVRNCLFETGATADDFGTNSQFDTADPCPNAASGDFTLRAGSNGQNAATDGADIGSGLSRSDVL